MLCKNCAREPLIFLPNRNILHPIPSAKGSNSQCDLHGEFRGVFRTTPSNYDEAFLQENSPSPMFHWVLNTPLNFICHKF